MELSSTRYPSITLSPSKLTPQLLDPSLPSIFRASISGSLALISLIRTWQSGFRLSYIHRYPHPIRWPLTLLHVLIVFVGFLFPICLMLAFLIFYGNNQPSCECRFLRSLAVNVCVLFSFQ